MTDDERADLDALLAAALRIAQREIEQVAAFDPFVLVVGSDGRMLSAEIDRSQLGRHPESEELAQAATEQLAGLAASVRATALTVTTRLAKERSDAIEVRLDHRAGTSLVVIMPFKRPKFGGRIEYGDTTSFRGAHEVWPS
ncbi:MAG: hypothetical protein KKH51_00150 [Actinobacteria bacterium]|nr:hypothetical protein [Actinomycetota bacterium]